MNKYLIATSHGKDPTTITRPMEYEDAAELYEQLTGHDTPRKLDPGQKVRYGHTTLREATLTERVTVEDDGARNLDYIIEEFPDERKDIAFKRASKELGYEGDEEDEDEFESCYHKHLVMMALDDLLDFHIREGNVRQAGIDSNGSIIYESTDPDKTVEEIL